MKDRRTHRPRAPDPVLMPRTIIEKLWDSHVVHEQPGAPTLLFIDLHLVHEVTSPQAFDGLRERGLKVQTTASAPTNTTGWAMPMIPSARKRPV